MKPCYSPPFILNSSSLINDCILKFHLNYNTSTVIIHSRNSVCFLTDCAFKLIQSILNTSTLSVQETILTLFFNTVLQQTHFVTVGHLTPSPPINKLKKILMYQNAVENNKMINSIISKLQLLP